MSQIVLPPGSTGADLQAAIDAAALGDTIIITGDMPFADTVTVPEEMAITVQSDDGNNRTMLQSGSSLLFKVFGSLTLNNLTLDGGGSGRGVEVTDGGHFTTNEVTVKNCAKGAVYVANNSVFDMTGGVIRDNSNDDDYGGGVSLTSHSTFNMTDGMIQNNTALTGGGVYLGENRTEDSGNIFNMTGGAISGNTAIAGGGVYLVYDCVFNMTGGTIRENSAEGGGGIYASYSAITAKDSSIIGNKANTYGGGIFMMYSVTMTMENGVISGNEVMEYPCVGGGIFMQVSGVEFAGKCYITNNTAHTGYGGGIWTTLFYDGEIDGKAFTVKNIPGREEDGIRARDPYFDYLITGPETVFGCNRAAVPHAPPPDAGTLYPDIQFAHTTIADHPLNNFDINCIRGSVITVRYNVTYDANGGTGGYTGPDTIPGGTDIVLSSDETGISREGYVFTGWNTEPYGGGTEYTPGEEKILNCDVTLYAQWVEVPIFTVTYGANGGTGGFVDPGRQYGTRYTVLSANQAGISRPRFLFTGWNTAPDGSGLSFAPGEVITISGDMALYAQWMQNPVPKPRRLCPIPVTKCRTFIEGQKIWEDDDNAENKRPPSVKIILLRDGKFYKSVDVDSSGDGAFGFCCVPVGKKPGHTYEYRIDEADVPGYTKTIEGYNVINTLIP